MSRPFILLTGDDSYKAEGTILVKRIVEKFADCKIVATKTQQSAVGSKINWQNNLWGTDTVDGSEAIWVDGSPSDAVLFAFSYLKQKPDLVVSGMNLGINIDDSLHRSGTLAAAITAAQIRHTPAVAFSMEAKDHSWRKEHSGELREELLTYPGKLIEKILRAAINYDFPEFNFWNVNFPANPTDKLVVTQTADPGFWPLHPHINGESFSYYDENDPSVVEDGDNDISLILKGKATLTPCKVEYTNYSEMEKLKRVNIFS